MAGPDPQLRVAAKPGLDRAADRAQRDGQRLADARDHEAARGDRERGGGVLMEPGPNTLRYRVNHTWTERKGWRWETTVELVGIAGDVIDLDNQLERAMRR